jgi:hypothetical protein
MRGYGRDYEDRGWFERAEDTVRGWFGGGPQYDRDYPASRPRSEWNHSMNSGGMWSRGPDRGEGYGGDYRTNNWNNQHAGWDTVRRAGSYYGSDFDDRSERYGAGSGGMDYDRDYGYRGGTSGGMSRGMGGGTSGGMSRGGMGGGTSGGMPERGGMRGSGRWMGTEYGGAPYRTGPEWGDYSGGGYGGQRWRNSTSGGVEPGRYFRGYGNGSTGGSGYEPY